jgi:hypothetical protein
MIEKKTAVVTRQNEDQRPETADLETKSTQAVKMTTTTKDKCTETESRSGKITARA